MAKNRRYAIGDIHGCILTFRYLVEDVLKIKAGDTLFLLGDYIDRGPGSREVIDYIRQLMSLVTVKPVMGNHEWMLLKTMGDKVFFENWSRNGCGTTLISFGAEPSEINSPDSVDLIPPDYIDFFRSLPLYEETDDFLFVHAGLGNGNKDSLKDEDTILWTRSEDPPEGVLGNRKLIHGHTPVGLSEIEQRIADTRSKVINLDGGCVYRYPGMGNLVALDLDNMKLYPVKCRD
ncbi:MAG: metallophosphoesterase family protein [Bacteroidetes bacterium]|nr:metallophosphoesterase family protein [Bacteroidota bacterium]